MGTQPIRLTSSEIAHLWISYMNDSASHSMLKYFLKNTEDAEIRPILEFADEVAVRHLQQIGSIFKNENHPIPDGFNDDDVNVNVPRLFSDTFYLILMKSLGKLGLSAYGVALGGAAREDVRGYFTQCITESSDLFNRVATVLLSKGLFIRSPYIPIPKQVEYVQSQSFFNSFFGEKRPLNSMEIAHLFSNLLTNASGKALMIGFSQVAKSEEVRNYMVRGKQIAAKQVELFGDFLTKDDLPTPMTWDAEVTGSTEAPFSDKLMMFITTALIAAGMGNYGVSMASSPRRDLGLAYSRLTIELAAYAEDGANILIEHGWMEKIPTAPDRNELARV